MESGNNSDSENLFPLQSGFRIGNGSSKDTPVSAILGSRSFGDEKLSGCHAGDAQGDIAFESFLESEVGIGLQQHRRTAVTAEPPGSVVPGRRLDPETRPAALDDMLLHE